MADLQMGKRFLERPVEFNAALLEMLESFGLVGK